MKKFKVNFKILFLPVLVLMTVMSCEFEETDFGLSGTIKGTVKDSQGNRIYGDVLTNDIVINLKGEGDQQAMETRLKGDGTFQHTKLYPKYHKIWITGPVIFTDTIYNDFSEKVLLEKDFIVTPFISPELVSATVNGTTLTVEFSIVENAGKLVNKSEVYCSTGRYPTTTLGTYGNFYTTIKSSLTGLSGTKNITGLKSGTKYYVRIGSQANGTTLWNYSNQIEITVP